MGGGVDLKKFLLTLLLLFILIISLISLRFGSALFQEGNPTPILMSIMILELSDSDYEQFSETNIHNRYISDNTGSIRYNKRLYERDGISRNKWVRDLSLKSQNRPL